MDYSQNKPLPKLPVNSQFYRRLLWFMLFNIHIHNSKKSYMFYFLEGEFKKGANSVCSFLYFVFKEVINSKTNQIIIFSDACGGQNRNYILVNFLLFCSIYYKIKIIQIFPVRGHSYCVCDRNFGIFSKKLKKYEKIEVPEKYVEILKECNFNVVKGSSYNIESAFKNCFKIPKTLKILEACKIEYNFDGTLFCYKDYNETPYFNSKISILNENLRLTLNNLKLDEKYFVDKNKCKDVLDLKKFLSPKSQEFYDEYLKQFL